MNEAKIYDALITYGGSGVSTIALRAKVHRSNAYDSLHRLIEKGLVYEVFGQRETIYEAVDPQKLLEISEEQTRKLQAIMPQLLSKFRTHHAPERVYIYKGIEGVKNYMRDALASGEDIYTLSGKGAWLDPRLKAFIQWFLKEMKRKKMKIFTLYDFEAQNKPPERTLITKDRYKFLPRGFATDSAIDIFGDHVVTFSKIEGQTWADDVTIFVMVSRPMADAFRTWWKMIWEMLPEPRRKR